MSKTIYSLRAELDCDVVEFSKTLEERGVYSVIIPLSMGEVAMEFEMSEDLHSVRTLLSEQTDSHVMVDTVRPIPFSQNDCSRQWLDENFKPMR